MEVNIPTKFQSLPRDPLQANQNSVSNQNGNILIIIGVIALILIVGGGAYYFGKSQATKSQSQSSIVPSQIPQGTPTLSPVQVIDETVNWKTYAITPDSSLGYESYRLKLPVGWKQIEHSSNFQGTETFQDGQNVYKLVIEEKKNYNDQTGKPFTSLKELVGFPYDITTLTVDGQQALRPLPRAGSEYIYKVLFFSRDVTLFYSITLETPRDGSKIQEGEALFNQILSTFKFAK